MENNEMYVPVDKTAVVILLSHYRIAGDISLLPGARLTDYVNASKEFIAVTNAEVQDHQGRPIFKVPFLDVNRDDVEVIAPAEGTAFARGGRAASKKAVTTKPRAGAK